MKIYQKIVSVNQAIENCKKSGNTEWQYKHEDALTKIERDYLPHGSGFDGDIQITEVSDKKVIINFDWHLMNDAGYYDGWFNLNIVITPSLLNGFDLKIQWYVNNNDKNKVYKYKPLLEDFLYDEFSHILDQEYKQETCHNEFD